MIPSRAATCRIAANGDREYISLTERWAIAIPKPATTLTFKGQVIPEAKRFVRLPPGGQLQPGMEWDASVVGGTSCGDMSFQYKAKSSEGTPFTLQMNGRPVHFRPSGSSTGQREDMREPE